MGGSMKTVAYLKTSLDRQEIQGQKQVILEFAQREKITVSRFIEMPVSSTKTTKEKKIDQLLDQLKSGDMLIVSELSRMGRSVGEIIRTVDVLVKGKICFIAIKEGIWLDEKKDLQNQVMIRMFGQLAEIECGLISVRTKEGLAAARAKGTKLGRPRGSLGKSRLDGRIEEIKKLLALGVSKASIAKITGVSRTTLCHFIKSRGLVQNP